ncbi:MAG: isoaspartyl peptidase/L-asparaginase [Limnochordaceae bacterium]|nr:isoaspartyl peptidase/L-asparaginase [Limnochordaceae bacterium]
MIPAVVVHGGAGRISQTAACQQGVLRAVQAGMAVLRSDGDEREASALEAVLAAVRVLEDDPVFNAGTGAVLNLDGQAELDAAVATGEGGFGAVGALQNTRHPVDVARLVMEQTDHLLLVGTGAERFARSRGVPPYNPIPSERLERWRREKERLRSGQTPVPYWQRLSKAELSTAGSTGTGPEGSTSHYSTVGAVAVDRLGRVAAATSTGGISLKLPGRIGDTPIMGAGTYAAATGAASATGHGEGIIRLSLTRRVVEQLKTQDAMRAARHVIDQAREVGVDAGVIVVDTWGNLGYAYNTPAMAWAWAKGDQVEVFPG